MELIFCDLDRTLIDDEYQLNNKAFFVSELTRICAQRAQIVLCSDSSLTTLEKWSRELGLSGHFVAERGAIILDAKSANQEIINPEKTSWLKNFSIEFERLSKSSFPETEIFFGEATELIRRIRNKKTSSHSKPLIAINSHRQASFSVFAFRPRNDKQGFEPDPQLLDKASNLSEQLLILSEKDKKELFWDNNPECGVLIIHSKETEKRLGVRRLIERLKPCQSYMIGDGISDFLNLPNVAQLAVANASIEYKKKVEFIAKSSLSSGVIECLEYIINPRQK